MSSYGFSVALKSTMAQAIAQVTDALKSEGFGILTEINIRDTLKAKLGVDTRPHVILGACNPQLAHQALTAEPDISLLLPCNVVVREEADGSVLVSFMDPVAVLKLTDNTTIAEIAQGVRKKLEQVRDKLK